MLTRADFATQWHQVPIGDCRQKIISTRSPKQAMPKLPEIRKRNCRLVHAKGGSREVMNF